MENSKEELARIKLPLSEDDYRKLKEIVSSSEVPLEDIPMEVLMAYYDNYSEEYGEGVSKYD